jgi:hypothetical protein
MFRGVFTSLIRKSDCVSLLMVFCPLVDVVILESRVARFVCTVRRKLLDAVWPPDDGRKNAGNMLRNNWLLIKSLIVASSWSCLYLLIYTFSCLAREYFGFSYKPFIEIREDKTLVYSTLLSTRLRSQPHNVYKCVYWQKLKMQKLKYDPY